MVLRELKTVRRAWTAVVEEVGDLVRRRGGEGRVKMEEIVMARIVGLVWETENFGDQWGEKGGKWRRERVWKWKEEGNWSSHC